jgi:hypothetical protein
MAYPKIVTGDPGERGKRHVRSRIGGEFTLELTPGEICSPWHDGRHSR